MTVWDQSVRSSLAARTQRLNASSKPAWGKMNASGMLAHVNDSYRMALGDLHCQPRNTPLRFSPLKQLIVYVLPFPKNVPTAPEIIARCDGAVLSDEQSAFAELLERLGKVTEATRLADHPAFGTLTSRAYGVLIARHTDHHLRQFGL
ncbi:MAG TPA: DUF1569 domain-containing protein [Vicinamibacterales bacterium]|nr:DUF1569 domain-containing protein [Vicinamibacterales bacterium]